MWILFWLQPVRTEAQEWNVLSCKGPMANIQPSQGDFSGIHLGKHANGKIHLTKSMFLRGLWLTTLQHTEKAFSLSPTFIFSADNGINN